MHTYAGDPTNFPETIGLIDDSDAPNASNFDVAPTNLADRTAWLRARATASLSAQGWQSIQLASSVTMTSIDAACWDPANSEWVIAGIDGAGFLRVFIGSGMGTDWRNIATATDFAVTSVKSVLKDPADATSFFVGVTTATPAFVVAKVNAATGAVTTSTGENGTFTDVQLAAIGSTLVVAVIDSAGTISAIFSSTNHGGSWNPIGLSVATATGKWYLAENGDSSFQGPQIRAVCSSTVGGGPGLNVSSLDGVTWSNDGFTSGGGNFVPVSGDVLVGLAYVETRTGPQWVIGVELSGGHNEFVSSPNGDGKNWLVASTTTGFDAVSFQDLASIGHALFVSTNWSSGANSGFAGGRGAFSVDGGTTWYWTEAILAPLTRPVRLKSSGAQLCAASGGAFRLSWPSGLPPYAKVS